MRPPHVAVSMVPVGDHTLREDGDALQMKQWDLDPRAGMTRGFRIVRSESDWRALWPTTDNDRIPLLPRDMNFGEEMLVVAAPPMKKATDVKVKAVIDAGEQGLHIYAVQELAGESCPGATKEKAPFDLVRVKKNFKEVHFHVEQIRDVPCGEGPEAKIACRANGTTAEFSEKVEVEPGKGVACIAGGKAGLRPTIDYTWSFKTLPIGTDTKMTIAKGGAGVSFDTDVIGTYALALETTDDLGRRSATIADIVAPAPKDALVAQMIWTKFDPKEDPSTFPRVELHVVGVNPPPVPANAKKPPPAPRVVPWPQVRNACDVGEASEPAWCAAKVIGPTTLVTLNMEASPQYRFGVHYTDDRFQGAPVVCIRIYRGAIASEACDTLVRKAGEWWDATTVDARTGKIPAPPAPPAVAPAAAASAPAPAHAPAPAPAPSSSAATSKAPAPAPAPSPKASGSPAPASSAPPH